MGALESVTDFSGISKQQVDGQWTSREPLRQRLAFEVLHNQKIDVVVAADVVQRAMFG